MRQSTDGAIRLSLTVNGENRSAGVSPGDSLLTALREQFGLPGAKNACEQGECGSCTVYLDGDPVCSCLVAAAQAEGRRVLTVEGLGSPGSPGGLPGQDAVQRAFLACGAVQCGFCTPGLVVAVHDLVHRPVEGPSGELDDATIREALAGNLCRCTGYEKIIEAVRQAAAEVRSEHRSRQSGQVAS